MAKKYVELQQCAMCRRIFRLEKLRDNLCPTCYESLHPTPIKPVAWEEEEQVETICKECGRVFMRNANSHPRFCTECNEKHKQASIQRRREQKVKKTH